MVMILGLDGYTLFHVAISLVGIAAGFVVLGGFLADARLDGAIHTFLATTVATDVTGFLFPFNGFLPSYAVGIISLIVLGVAIYAYYAARLAGSWRAIFVIASVVALYLNVFVLIAQTFQKIRRCLRSPRRSRKCHSSSFKLPRSSHLSCWGHCR